MSLHLAYNNFDRQLIEMKQLAADAHTWTTVNWSLIPTIVNPFSKHHKELITQIAFLQSFLEWEHFLEESFILYLLGNHPPTGVPPRRYANPPDRLTAEKMVSEGRPYADWTRADLVVDKASRFFDAGTPYSAPLKLKQSTLEEIKTIRNALAHSSYNSKEKFKRLVRSELGSYPPKLTIGGFLGMTIPHTSSKATKFSYPISYFEFYIDTFLWLAKEIIPV